MNPKTIWQSQGVENLTMSVYEIREKIRRVRAKSRREMVFNLVVSVACTVLFINVFFRYVHGLYAQISWGLTIAGAFYMVGYIVYESIRTLRAEAIFEDAGVSSCLTFYRRVLEQKLQHFRHMAFAGMLLVAGGVMNYLPAFSITIQNPDGNMWLRLLPFVVILGLWGVLYRVMRMRIRRDFRREFRMLETLEREYSDR